MVNAQEYINERYPTRERKEEVSVLDIRRQDLEGKLDLSEFINLEILNCSENKLTELDLHNLTQLEILVCRDNHLTNINYPFTNPEKLFYLSIRNNNLQKQGLSVFDKFVNLKELWIGNDDKEKIENGMHNRFFGSLGDLRNMSDLEELYLNNTDLDGGVEYLPDNINNIYYSTKERPESRIKEISYQLDLLKNKKQNQWEKLGFAGYKEIKPWIEIGLTFNDYCLADCLKNEKKLSPEKAESRLGELKREYSLFWKNMHKDFNEELQKKWEERGFKGKQVKEWMSAGLQPWDAEFAEWLRDVKKKDVEQFKRLLGEVGEQNLRKEYNLYSQLTLDVIKRLECLPVYPHLTIEQELLIKELIPNEELRKRYKKWGLCSECRQPNTNYKWCKLCNFKHFQQEFKNWASGSPEIDKFIQKTQLKASSSRDVLEWIPYGNFWSVEHLAVGGFGTIYRAALTSGKIASWNIQDGKWERTNIDRKVVLKILTSSQDITVDFLQEVTNHELFNNNYRIVKCYGISQDPATKNYIMVMEYIKHGNLRQYLNTNKCLGFREKIDQLYYVVAGLNSVHEKGLVHCDFHPGNVLLSSKIGGKCHITDLGLCRPANETDNSKVYGILPYVAPEVLLSNSYLQASDVYSFAMIAYEVLTGLPPYVIYNEEEDCYQEVVHNTNLALKICQGLRPSLDYMRVPQLLKDLINQCWDSEPLKRPLVGELVKILNDWWSEIGHYSQENTEFYRQYKEIENAGGFSQTLSSTSANYKPHSQVIYASKMINTKEITRRLQGLKVSEEYHAESLEELTLDNFNLDDIQEEPVESSLQAQIQTPPK